jgi:hypothetical protein
MSGFEGHFSGNERTGKNHYQISQPGYTGEDRLIRAESAAYCTLNGYG